MNLTMFKNLNRKFKIRLVLGFFFMIAIDFIFYFAFESNVPLYLKVIGSIFTSGFIVFGLAFVFNKYKKVD